MLYYKLNDQRQFSPRRVETSAEQAFKIYQLNIQCIRNKLDMLNVWLQGYDYDILTINEHWLCPEEHTLYVPIGYSIGSFHCRTPPLIRGGCSIFVKEGIEFNTLVVDSFCTDFVFEVSAIHLTKNLIL